MARLSCLAAEISVWHKLEWAVLTTTLCLLAVASPARGTDIEYLRSDAHVSLLSDFVEPSKPNGAVALEGRPVLEWLDSAATNNAWVDTGSFWYLNCGGNRGDGVVLDAPGSHTSASTMLASSVVGFVFGCDWNDGRGEFYVDGSLVARIHYPTSEWLDYVLVVDSLPFSTHRFTLSCVDNVQGDLSHDVFIYGAAALGEVPEPSTFALLAIGIIGVSLCALRRWLSRRAVAGLAACAVVLSVSVADADIFGVGTNQFTLSFVPISGATNPTSGYGIVNHDYRMGTYEITNDQWNKFTASLGIPVTGADAGYSTNSYYTGTNVPTDGVSWFEAAQFVNWLNTSTGYQPPYKFTGTQGTDSYTFAAWNSADAGYDASNPYRNKVARYFLPTENEWVKAAYWNGRALQTYATKAGESLTQGNGTSRTGWNYYTTHYATTPYGPWAVGSGSQELNGTYDMMGNDWEWMESPYTSGDYGASSSRGMRGGGWSLNAVSLASSSRYGYPPTIEGGNYLGFRVAGAVPEPSAITLLTIGAVGLLAYAWRRRKLHNLRSMILAAMVVLAAGSAQAGDHAVWPTDWNNWSDPALVVAVGNPGNAPDTRYNAISGVSAGAVPYVYNIGKFEVTAGQYTAFLNAVAKTDAYGLYNVDMTSSEGCQITQHGASGSYTYDFSGRPSGAESDWAVRPVNFVSWGDSARFANWLHNGQPTGEQSLSTTEDGAYYLNGATTSEALLAVSRKTSATWVIPGEDEWYKAAYYKSGGTNTGYWDYPTKSSTSPVNTLLGTDPGNHANFGVNNVFTIGSPYYRTEVGDFENSASAYGTYDQGGNVWEWNETLLAGSSRVLRGGGWFFGSHDLAASYRNYSSDLSFEGIDLGFRVASVPEPASIALLLVGTLGLLVYAWRRHRT
jgi:formylglycine-generating enzyme